jgi:hypothetical protein
MPNNNAGGGGSGAMTALLAILVIAVIAFGIWYVMAHSAPAQAPAPNGGLQVNVGGTAGGNPPAQNPAPSKPTTY